MKISKSFCLIAILVLGGIKGYSQNIYFHYDNVGNRTERSLSSVASRGTGESDSTSVEDLLSKGGYETLLYPNSSFGVFNISMGTTDGPVELYVYDIRGHILYQQRYNQVSIQFDISEYPTGIYLVKWRTREKSYTEKIIKR